MGNLEAIDVTFWLLALVTMLSAVIVAVSRSLIHSVFALFFTLLGVAGLYVLLGADFLAIVQITLYIGGILVLMIFGVMLTNRIGATPLKAEFNLVIPALVLSILTFVLVVGTFLNEARLQPAWNRHHVDMAATDQRLGPNQPLEPIIKDTTRTIGLGLLGPQLVPFEVASLVLLVAMIGSASIARKELE